MVDENPYLLHQLLFFPVDVSIIVITYLTLIRLIVMSFFGIFDRVFPGWDPGIDTHTPSLRCILCIRPKLFPQEHRWNFCRKQNNRQWDRRHVYPFQFQHFHHQPPGIVPKDHRSEAAMPLLIPAFCIAAGSEQWCHKLEKFLTASPTAEIICIYFFCVRHRHNTLMFHAFAGTVREDGEHPRSIQFDTDSYQIGIENFASGCMFPNRDHFITYKASKVQECKGIAAGLNIEGRGTFKFRIDDDNGITHTITVPNSVHNPGLPMVLVSPQHWAQQTSDGIESTSGAKSSILNFL